MEYAIKMLRKLKSKWEEDVRRCSGMKNLEHIKPMYKTSKTNLASIDKALDKLESTSSLPIGDIRHRYFVVAYTGENSKGSFLGSVDIDCTGGYPSSASVIEYIKGLKSKPNNVIITDMRELTEEDYLAWCGANDA